MSKDSKDCESGMGFDCVHEYDLEGRIGNRWMQNLGISIQNFESQNITFVQLKCLTIEICKYKKLIDTIEACFNIN